MTRHALVAVLIAGTTLPALAACTSNTSPSAADEDPRSISVVSTDDECRVSSDTAPAGNLVYHVTNDGSQVSEFYLYGEDGLRILGEVENIGPGLSRDLVVNVPAGSYVTACKPGMVGKGIRADFTVEKSKQGAAVTGATEQQVRAATRQYHAYVEDQTEQLLAGTRRFVAAYTAGRDDQARASYPLVRVHWERIEPVAESFGDLDPKMDLRQADLEPGQQWTGWHRIEKDLWPPATYQALTDAQRRKYGAQLLADTRTLSDRVEGLTFTVDQIGNGAKSLLDEVATGKVTGEEEIWSHTDLYDFQANVDGARVAFEGLRPVLAQKDPALEEEIARRFGDLQQLLDRYRVGKERFVPYTELSTGEVKRLSDAVNALSEPLARLTAAVAL